MPVPLTFIIVFPNLNNASNSDVFSDHSGQQTFQAHWNSFLRAQQLAHGSSTLSCVWQLYTFSLCLGDDGEWYYYIWHVSCMSHRLACVSGSWWSGKWCVQCVSISTLWLINRYSSSYSSGLAVAWLLLCLIFFPDFSLQQHFSISFTRHAPGISFFLISCHDGLASQLTWHIPVFGLKQAAAQAGAGAFQTINCVAASLLNNKWDGRDVSLPPAQPALPLYLLVNIIYKRTQYGKCGIVAWYYLFPIISSPHLPISSCLAPPTSLSSDPFPTPSPPPLKSLTVIGVYYY